MREIETPARETDTERLERSRASGACRRSCECYVLMRNPSLYPTLWAAQNGPRAVA